MAHGFSVKRRGRGGVAVAALWAAIAALGMSACAPAAPGSALSTPAQQSSAPPQATCIPSELGGCLSTAPEKSRVDLAAPAFSNPTEITNPLHPTRQLESAVLLGRADGRPFRVEVTLLPATRTIDWGGRPIETLMSQYVAFLDGRIQEVALDLYAQADDGSVWYFGEDVFNYEDGVVADTHGTWLAGRDGPPAMIMPADPQVGDVYRPENVPGLVFEEVTVRATGKTVDGPTGPVAGAILVDELHMDGSHEDKTFAPGYGEFSTGSGENLEAIALGVPTDSLEAPLPAELITIFQSALAIDESGSAGEWAPVSDSYERLTAAWDAFRSSGTPPMLESQMTEALESLAAATEARDAIPARQAALHTALAALDFQLRHLAPAEVDLARLGVWLRQLRLDTEVRDIPGAAGDVATLEWIRDRLAGAVSEADFSAMNAAVEELRTTVEAEETGATLAAVDLLLERIAGMGIPD